MSESTLRNLEQLIEQDPSNSSNFVQKADTLMRLGRYKESIDTCDYIIENFGNILNTYHIKGYSQYSLSLKNEAIESYLEELRLFPDNLYVFLQLGAAYTNLDNHKAIKYLKEGLKTQSYAWAFRNLAYCYVMIKDDENALKFYDEALMLEPNDFDSNLGKGILLFRTEKFQEAINLLEICIELKPERKYSHYIKALCLKNINRMDEAHKLLLEVKSSVDSKVGLEPYEISYLEKNILSVIETTQLAIILKKNTEKIANTGKTDENTKKKINDVEKELKNMMIDENNSSLPSNLNNITKNDENKIRRLEEMIQQLSEAIEKNTKEDERREKDIKAELDNKMDNFSVIISKKVESLKISENYRVNITDYYHAFLNTFSSSYINSVVIDSDSVTLEVGSITTDVLSKCVSFIPVVGENLSEGVKSVGEFLNKMDIKKRARKFKNLFPSPTQLELVVGKAFANTIGSEDYIAEEIININENREFLNCFEKMKKKFDEFNDIVDDKLYGKKYIDDTYKMGVEDANEIIAYLSGEDTDIDSKKVGPELERSWRGLFLNKKNIRKSTSKLDEKMKNEKTTSLCSCFIY
jgi:tetratricopeptide (TPR) repeat protein